jgi:hypothetical protein
MEEANGHLCNVFFTFFKQAEKIGLYNFFLQVFNISSKEVFMLL